VAWAALFYQNKLYFNASKYECMKLFSTIALILLAGPAALQAQQTAIVYKVKPGERVDAALQKANALYQYPQFQEAQVTLKNRSSGTVLMNYNRLLGDMQFINGKGDTLALDKGNDVAAISIGKDTFFYAEGYLKLLDDPRVRIEKKKVLRIAYRERIGGKGEVSQGSTMYTSMYSSYGVKDLVASEALTFSDLTTYYIGDRYNNFKPLNRKNLRNYYSKQVKQIDAYLKENPVNFFDEADVQRLVLFLKTL